jgi:glyoxylase-like metal-dependent hydrolase (beta-lactamase superfamily II)
MVSLVIRFLAAATVPHAPDLQPIPMPQASDLLRLSDSLWLWHVYDPAVKSDLFSSAVKTDARLFLIDPIPLAPSCLEEMAVPIGGASVLVTNLNHLRAAAAFARQFDAPIFAARLVVGEFSATSARTIADGERIGPGVSAVVIDGAATGETAFHFADDGGTMVVGDALINFEPYGFTLLPPKYCSDQKAMRRSLRRLLDWPFEHLLFAHGTPILTAARERLEMLLR